MDLIAGLDMLGKIKSVSLARISYLHSSACRLVTLATTLSRLCTYFYVHLKSFQMKYMDKFS